MKPDRQAVIREIISSQTIETQNQLMEALAARGVRSTQATVSRDIREMRLVKDLGPDGRYRYQLPSKDITPEFDLKLRKIFRESITSYEVAQNIVVLKTLPGLASAACSALDSMKLPHLVGSLAGDDTAFLAMSDKDSAVEFCKLIEEMLK
ncbi:MAG: arginine repressor [Oscillospiraceae bacterium]|nr:arginine repressor [Oscillospiraceae bacterium]MDD6503618.1 arginine repressor [Oscillospiraceae bacterium]MDY4105655.1 arginine repressor [Oscillospiraceae bacterium]